MINIKFHKRFNGNSRKKAKKLFIQGSDHFDMFQKALEQDPYFATAHLYLYMSISGDRANAVNHLEEAKDLAGQASEGESIIWITTNFSEWG